MQPLGVLAFDADDDPHLRVRVAAMRLNEARVDCRELLVEIAGLWLEVCPGRFAHESSLEKLTLGIGGFPARDGQLRGWFDGLFDH